MIDIDLDPYNHPVALAALDHLVFDPDPASVLKHICFDLVFFDYLDSLDLDECLPDILFLAVLGHLVFDLLVCLLIDLDIDLASDLWVLLEALLALDHLVFDYSA